MIEFFAAFLMIYLLSSIAVMIRRGLNEIIQGMESIDRRLANLEQISSTNPKR